MRKTKLLILFLLIIVLLILGYRLNLFSHSNTDLSTLSTAPIPTPTPSSSPADLIQQFISSFANIDSYTATIDTTKDGQTTTITVNYTKPNITEVTYAEDSGLTHIISTDAAVYVKKPDSSQWLQMPPETQTDFSDIEFDLQAFQRSAASSSAQPTYLGTQTCQDKVCHVFETTSDPNKSTIMFDITDYLLRQVDISGSEQVHMEYQYPGSAINLPQQDKIFVLPSNPTDDQLRQAQEILGM